VARLRLWLSVPVKTYVLYSMDICMDLQLGFVHLELKVNLTGPGLSTTTEVAAAGWRPVHVNPSFRQLLHLNVVKVSSV
jgi:hypothetical protein